MRFLVRLSNAGKYKPSDRKPLTTQAYGAVQAFGADIGNLRVSNSAVELDLLLDSGGDVDEAVKALESKIGKSLTVRLLDVETPSLGNQEAIKLGLTLFNEERYWESHEALEIAWRRLTGPEKEILQGIILIAAALVHLQKDEQNIALSIMKRAHTKLVSHAGIHFGIDVPKLNGKVFRMISSGSPAFFTIEG